MRVHARNACILGTGTSVYTLSGYKYNATAVFYFDDKERSSLNLNVEQDDLGDTRKRKITIGFGIKL